MYNNTQRNRAGALEELNKFFLGKDEQIALSDLPPLRSPQAMPRGYKDGENVTQDTGAGSLLGPSSTPGMVIDPDFKGISGLDVEFDPTTGEVTDLGRKTITDYLDRTKSQHPPDRYDSINDRRDSLEKAANGSINQSALSAKALVEQQIVNDIVAQGKKRGLGLKSMLGLPESANEEDMVNAVAKGMLGIMVGPLASRAIVGMFKSFDEAMIRSTLNYQIQLRAESPDKSVRDSMTIENANLEAWKDDPIEYELMLRTPPPPTQTQPVVEQTQPVGPTRPDRVSRQRSEVIAQAGVPQPNLTAEQMDALDTARDNAAIDVYDLPAPPALAVDSSALAEDTFNPTAFVDGTGSARTFPNIHGLAPQSSLPAMVPFDPDRISRNIDAARNQQSLTPNVPVNWDTPITGEYLGRYSGILNQSVIESITGTPVNSVATIDRPNQAWPEEFQPASRFIGPTAPAPAAAPAAAPATPAGPMNATMTPYALSQITPYPLSREEQAARMAGAYPARDHTDIAFETVEGTNKSYPTSYGYPDAPSPSGGSGGGTGGEPGPSGGGHGGLNKGGPVNMQEGGEIDNADTDLESRLGPMGVIRDPNGAPGPSRGGAGVSDDLTMEVPVGSYVLNADAVERIGSTYINDKIKEAYDVALASGQEVPANYNPEDKVVIRISNGEALIPKPLVGPIGQRLLEKWNNEGLKVRANRKQEEEKMMAQQKLQGPQVASEAPPVQPQSPMQAQMGGLMGYNQGDEVEDDRDLGTRIADFLGLGDFWRAGELTEENLKQRTLDMLDPKNITSFQNGGPSISSWEKFVEGVKDTPENILKWFTGTNESEVPPRPIPRPKDLVSQPEVPPLPRARPKDLVSQPEVPPLPRARPKDLVSQPEVPPLPRARPKDLVSQPKVSIPNQTFYDGLYTQISEHEGPRLKVYNDKVTDGKGNVTIVPTVGIGYNLNNATAQQDFRKIGANYNAVKKGAVDLTETQMRNLYDISVERAEEDVRSLVPDFDNLPANIQKVLIDMSFNLGKTRLTKFPDMLKAVNAKNPNYTNMKKEMINSIWYKQVGIRSKNLVKLVEEEIKPPLPKARPK